MATKRRPRGARNSSASPKGASPSLQVRLTQLEAAQKRLEEAHNHNTSLLSLGFQATDRRQATMMRVMNDIIADRGLYADAEGILWGAYATEYECAVAFIKLAETHGPSVAQQPEEEQVPTFGGDL